MAEHRSPGWRELLQDALSELNIEKLPEKIALAEVVVRRRITASRPTKAERQALDDALISLSILKKRHFPGWNKGSLMAKRSR